MNSKNSLALLVATVLLFGCATPENDLRKRPASLELTSRHSADRVATCIAGRWKHATEFEPTGGYPIDVSPLEGGYSVSAIARNLFDIWTGALAYVENTPDGSTTRYFENGVGTEEAFDNAVKECQ
jgi:hypothetical protein